MKDALGTNFTVHDRVALMGDPEGEIYIGRVTIVNLVDNSVVVECDHIIDRRGNVASGRMTIQADRRWALVLK